MFKTLPFEAFEAAAKTHRHIAVYQEIPGDTLTPIQALAALKKNTQDLALLQINAPETSAGPVSTLCFDPIASLHAHGNNLTLNEAGHITQEVGNPFELLRTLQQRYQCAITHPRAGFAGGLVGYLRYHAAGLIEAIPNRHQRPGDPPDLVFRYYRHHVIFDHPRQRILLQTIVSPTGPLFESYQQARDTLDALATRLTACPAPSLRLGKETRKRKTPITVDVSNAAYIDQVNEAKAHIAAGDIFQIVLSRTFSMPVTASPLAVYRALTFTNPAPYHFYIEEGERTFIGASPEKLLSIQAGQITSSPLAGTRARGTRSETELAEALRNDPKENAEHLMLVDLARNDVGRVACPGSVSVTRRQAIEYHPQVIHLSSTVTGKLSPAADVFDALAASFPAGTVSGAPKIKAMTLIDGLETTPRGLYGGMICAIDAQQNLTSCLAIRTAVLENGRASVRAGAGIVHDSNPQAEADETYHKAKAILSGLLLAEGEHA